MILGDPARSENASPLDGGSLHVTPAEARRALEHARPLSITRAREMALFWRKLSGRTPILSGKGDRAAPGRKELFMLGDYQAGFFPRKAARGLLLSRFDELLFSCLGEDGSPPVEVFVSRAAAGEALRSWLGATGDVFLAARLAQWARHGGAEAALESEPLDPENVMKAARYSTGRASPAPRQCVSTSASSAVHASSMLCSRHEIVLRNRLEHGRIRRRSGESS